MTNEETEIVAQRTEQARSNWRLVQKAVEERSETLTQNLQNTKIQLAAAQTRELQLQQEVAEKNEKVERKHTHLHTRYTECEDVTSLLKCGTAD